MAISMRLYHLLEHLLVPIRRVVVPGFTINTLTLR